MEQKTPKEPTRIMVSEKFLHSGYPICQKINNTATKWQLQ